MAKITVMVQGKTQREIKLNKDSELTVGRDAANDICLDNPAVSRFHAKIYKQGWPYYIEDLKSTNGTILNGKTVSWKAPLSRGDKITVGKHTLVFTDDPSDYEDGKGSPEHIDATLRVAKKG